jgi:hypothetical protein
MATTTNYSWSTPDDTALVKDGASAIRTLGSSVDTTTKALNPSTTLGDIEYRSSTANTNTRLGIGTTGQVLTVAGGVPSWAAAATGGMTLISTTTANNDASISLSSIPQTYVHLQVIVKNFRCSSDNNQFCFRYNNNSGTNYRRIFGSSTDNTSFDFNEDKARLVNGLDSVETYNHIVINIPNYADSTIWKIASAIKAEAEAKAIAKQAIADRLGLTADELKLILG